MGACEPQKLVHHFVLGEFWERWLIAFITLSKGFGVREPEL